MKKSFEGIFSFLVFMTVLFLGCANLQPTNWGDIGSSAGPDESEIVVQRSKVDFAQLLKMNVFVDGQLRLTLGNGEDGMIIVPNGNHTIYTEMNSITKSEIVPIVANSSRIIFSATPQQGMAVNPIVFRKVDEILLDP